MYALRLQQSAWQTTSSYFCQFFCLRKVHLPNKRVCLANELTHIELIRFRRIKSRETKLILMTEETMCSIQQNWWQKLTKFGLRIRNSKVTAGRAICKKVWTEYIKNKQINIWDQEMDSDVIKIKKKEESVRALRQERQSRPSGVPFETLKASGEASFIYYPRN